MIKPRRLWLTVNAACMREMRYEFNISVRKLGESCESNEVWRWSRNQKVSIATLSQLLSQYSFRDTKEDHDKHSVCIAVETPNWLLPNTISRGLLLEELGSKTGSWGWGSCWLGDNTSSCRNSVVNGATLIHSFPWVSLLYKSSTNLTSSVYRATNALTKNF